MEIVNYREVPSYNDDHPESSLHLHYLFEGEDNTPENYQFALGHKTGKFFVVRHRHNFEQFRFAVKGPLSVHPGKSITTGKLCYFPEGAPYGPQDEPADQEDRWELIVQFGGASGAGYVSTNQFRDAYAALSEKGEFKDNLYVVDEGKTTEKKVFGLNPMWEYTFGKKIKIPKPRYDSPIFVNPAAFRWLPQKEQGVFRKPLGTFSEQEVVAEQWRIETGATLTLEKQEATRLMFVLEGKGSDEEGATMEERFALRLKPNKSGKITAQKPMLLISYILPVLTDVLSAEQPEAPSVRYIVDPDEN